MSQTPITIKIDSTIKLEAQQLARQMGLSLSTIIENKLREVIRDRRVTFDAAPEPTPAMAARLRQIEADIAANRNLSPSMQNADDLEAYLSGLSHDD